MKTRLLRKVRRNWKILSFRGKYHLLHKQLERDSCFKSWHIMSVRDDLKYIRERAQHYIVEEAYERYKHLRKYERVL